MRRTSTIIMAAITSLVLFVVPLNMLEITRTVLVEAAGYGLVTLAVMALVFIVLEEMSRRQNQALKTSVENRKRAELFGSYSDPKPFLRE